MQQFVSRRTFVRKASGATLAAFGALLAPTLAGCSKASSGRNASLGDDEVVICMGPASEPASGFDPLFGWGAGEHSHEPLIQSTLIKTTVNMDFENDLATDYMVSSDGLVWTFTLRDDVCFSDATPLTAHDVVFTLDKIKTTQGSSTDLSMIKTVVAKDANTLELHLESPYNALLYTLAVIGIVPAHAYGQGYSEHPIGSGRYLLEQWDKGQQIILKANPSYYGSPPLMQRVVVVFMEESAALAAVRGKMVDIAATSAVFGNQDIAGYELFSCKSVDSRGISLPVLPAGSTKNQAAVSYPVGNAVTSDLAIRRALNFAVDRNLMINSVINGFGTAAFSVADGMPWASKDMQVLHSINEAERVLAEAGWESEQDGIRAKGGLRASFELLYPSYDSLRQSLANEFSNQARKVGIEVRVKGLSWDEIYPRQFVDPVLWGWGSNSPVELYNLYHSQGSCNFTCYEDAAIDRSLLAALAAPSFAESFPMWQKAQWDSARGQGVAPQGAATWVWLANVDHLYFKRTELVVAAQKLHPHGHGWSLVNNVDLWSWH